ncbi:acyltransferase family protein [Sphingomonas sp.]|uniref:acyltransferase family protein n=1 Tax=Sphingomonas sp. TaxID=28214 RepID=UPI003AFF7307
MNAPVLLRAREAALLAPPLTTGAGQRDFLPHVHRMRGLAILLVVAAHCWPCFAWTPAQEHAILLLLDNVTVLFMFISGFLFQHLSPRFRYAAYLKRRMGMVMLPYLLVSMPGIAMAVFVAHREDVWPWVYRLPAWQQVAFFLVTGRHLAPLWFMPMMALFILAAPLFVRVDRRGGYGLILPLAAAFATATGRDWAPGLANVLSKASFMAPAYLAGMAFSRHRLACEAWCEAHWRLLLALLCAITAAIASRWFAADLSLIQKLVMAPLVLMLATRVPGGGHVDAALTRLATLSFGIYFVHGYVISAARIACANLGAPSHPAGTVFVPSAIALAPTVAMVTIASVAIVEAVRRVAGERSRYLIGA